ncbi:hypothetical protein [Erythrobacter tepidarius]|nr:hypothetical protein [Erythrobacter tepidarius]
MADEGLLLHPPPESGREALSTIASGQPVWRWSHAPGGWQEAA